MVTTIKMIAQDDREKEEGDKYGDNDDSCSALSDSVCLSFIYIPHLSSFSLLRHSKTITPLRHDSRHFRHPGFEKIKTNVGQGLNN